MTAILNKKKSLILFFKGNFHKQKEDFNFFLVKKKKKHLNFVDNDPLIKNK